MNICSKVIYFLIMSAMSLSEAMAQFDNGAHYLINVATNMYLGGANNYGTQASLIQHGQPFYLTKQSDGSYLLDSKTYNGSRYHYLGSNLFIDSNPTGWTFEEIREGVYALSCASGSYLSYNGHSTALINSSNCNSSASWWKVVSEKERIDNLTPGSDATFLMRDANFSRSAGMSYDKPYWTIYDASDYSKVNISTGNSSNNCAVAFNTTFDVGQTVRNVPIGKYSLVAQGFYCVESGRASYTPEFYLNDETQAFVASNNGEKTAYDACTSFALELYNVSKLNVTVYDGTMSVGARLEKKTNLLCFWDNMRLTYIGDLDYDGYVTAKEQSLAAARKVVDFYANKELSDKLDAMIENSDKVGESFDELKEYVSNLNSLTAQIYESAEVYKVVYNNYQKYTSLDEKGQQLYQEWASDVYYAYVNRTITDGEAELLKLDAVYNKAFLSQITPGLDMTSIIVNPNIDGSSGWTIEKPNGGNGPLLNGNSFEYWGGGSLDEEDRLFNYYQTVTGLQNGVFTVSCDAYNSMDGVKYDFAPSSGLYAKSGDVTVRTIITEDSKVLKTITTPEIQVVDGTLTFGVRNFNTMVARWFVADNFRLTLVKADDALGVADIDEASQEVDAIYSVDGTIRKEIGKGINIVRYKNGNIRKVFR